VREEDMMRGLSERRRVMFHPKQTDSHHTHCFLLISYLHSSLILFCPLQSQRFVYFFLFLWWFDFSLLILFLFIYSETQATLSKSILTVVQSTHTLSDLSSQQHQKIKLDEIHFYTFCSQNTFSRFLSSLFVANLSLLLFPGPISFLVCIIFEFPHSCCIFHPWEESLYLETHLSNCWCHGGDWSKRRKDLMKGVNKACKDWIHSKIYSKEVSVR
jgi:hypothetical protein